MKKYKYSTNQPNDPSSPTPPTATVERTENVGLPESSDRKAGAAFGAAPLLGHIVCISSPILGGGLGGLIAILIYRVFWLQ